MAIYNFSNSDFTINKPYHGNLNIINTRDTNMKRAMVKMGDPVEIYGALQMTSAGTKTGNARVSRRQCLTKDDMYRDRVDCLEQIDKGSLKNSNFLQRWWKAIVNSPSSFLVPQLYLGQNKTRTENLLFDQLVGLDEPKEEMKLIAYCIIRSSGSNRLTPPAVLLHGPAGTGKTSLVNALARQANVTFLPVIGEALAQDEKAKERLKSIFSKARVGAPSIIFIHGVEAVKAVTQLENEITRCKNDGIVVIVVATAVKVDKINPELMNLFTVECCLEEPDLQTRVKMAEVLLRKLNVVEEDKETIRKSLAYETDGFVWNDLELVCIKSQVLANYEGVVSGLVTKEHISRSLKDVKALLDLRDTAKR